MYCQVRALQARHGFLSSLVVVKGSSPVCGSHGVLTSFEAATVTCLPRAATGGALQGYLRGGPGVCGQLWRGGGPGPACLHHEPAAEGLGAHAARKRWGGALAGALLLACP